jgi:hypothetical protein
LNADLYGPVRVEAAVELAKCITFGTPSGAGVLVILPDESNVCCDFFFLVEPSKPPYLRVLKLAKPADLTNEWTSLHSEPLPHCFGQQEVLVEVTVLDDMITISTNSVLSAWALKVPATGGPKRLRAFGLCGIGPRRISWSSFHVSVVEAQTSREEPSWLEDDPENDPELATVNPYYILRREENLYSCSQYYRQLCSRCKTRKQASRLDSHNQVSQRPVPTL